MALKAALVPDIVRAATGGGHAIPLSDRLQQAQRFLTLLDEGQEHFTFQTFDDNKARDDKRFARILHGTIEDHFHELTALNNKGAGVFVTVNETDLQGRKLENMVRPRAVFQEADRPGTPEPPLTPHIQVESSPGKFHRYLVVDKEQHVEWSEWEGVERRMVADHGSDPNAKDRARVLRLPGFFHMKNPDAPHLVQIVAESGELPYQWARIADAIPPMAEPDHAAMETALGRGLTEPIKLRSALNALSADCEYGEWLQRLMALHHASGGSGEGLRIADQWSATGKGYREREVAYKWASFGKYTGPQITQATIYQAAIEGGWNWDTAMIEALPEARSIAGQVILDSSENPKAYLEYGSIEAFRVIKIQNPREYECLRQDLKASNSRIRIGALDKFVAPSQGEAVEKQSQASELADLARSRCELFHDADGNGYATFERDGHNEHWKLESTGFREWLAYLAHSEQDAAPSNETLRSVITTLVGSAKFDGEELGVFTRIAKTEAGHWIDIGDDAWRAILVTATGWKIVSNPPVKFVRGKSTRPLPEPVTGGDIALLWDLVNIPEEDRPLVLAWLLESLRADTPFPALEFIGEQGSGKSSTQALIRQFVDHSKVLLRGRPKTVEDIFVAAAQNHVVSYENLSSLSPEMSDALCSISTGAGYASRQLYTNGEEATMTAHNPVMLNGIGAVVTRHDLLDRTIALVLPTITNRMTEAQIQTRIEATQGRIMGAILDTFAGALAKLTTLDVDPKQLPRMADFALLGEAMGRHLGMEAGAWLNIYAGHRREAIHRTIDASPVAAAVIEFVGSGKSHCGTVKALLGLLNNETVDMERGDYWPKSPKGMADSLRRVAPALRQMGVHVAVDAKRKMDGIHCVVRSADRAETGVVYPFPSGIGGKPGPQSSSSPQQRTRARL